MRFAAALIFASAVSLCVSGSAWSQTAAPSPRRLRRPQPPGRAGGDRYCGPCPRAGSAPAPLSKAACTNPDALGIARVVEIDTTGGPGFGFEHFKQLDFLRDQEVVLTFDDGPWLVNTPAGAEDAGGGMHDRDFLSDRQARNLLSGNPEGRLPAAGHTIGSHTWSHATLTNKKLTEDQRKEEIEKGFSAVKWALGGVSPAPFFRFPALQHPPEMVTYLGTRNIAMFSCDLNSFDFKARNAQQVIDVDDEEARQARQRHHPDARFPQAHRRSPARTAAPAEGRRLQGRADDRQSAGADPGAI